MCAKVGFSILNFNSLDETNKCIESIREYCDVEDYKIVIVDNASMDGSGTRLSEVFVNDNKVHVIISNENLGFARGNNIGFRYLKEQGCDYICLLNSDIELREGFSVQKIDDYYEKYGYAVLGPKIITNSYNSGKCNPVRTEPLKVSPLLITYVKLLIRLAIWEIGLGSHISYDGNRKRLDKSNIDYDRHALDVELHGCCLIFSRAYIDRKDGLNESTFMYGEEDILYYELLSEGLKTLYAPDICVLHNEKKSTDNTFSRIREKRLFEYKNRIRSMHHVLKAARCYWGK